MLERGYLASSSFYSMYAHTDMDVCNYLSAVDETFSIVKSSVKQPEKFLKGRPSVEGFKRLS